MESELLVAGLLDASLPQAEWTHRGHISAAHALVRAHGPERALTLIRGAIPLLNDAHGVPNTDDDGYHETLTVFYTWAVADAITRGLDADETAAALPSDAPFAFWSRDVLFTPTARRTWVAPDLAAPPFPMHP